MPSFGWGRAAFGPDFVAGSISHLDTLSPDALYCCTTNRRTLPQSPIRCSSHTVHKALMLTICEAKFPKHPWTRDLDGRAATLQAQKQ
eukprot:1186199-Prorocentrum_minimum.AAC.3